ncbi:hypothetical protein CMUS01_09025 [Colletotrichum musicola]|uniref:Uncharacterized protein n=1 Tax=Colletotrichum musicola TaxID=2175873 RepID=A0A8H6NC44_9PEZI|nr:hypothetical protein CMUS01_09025 [Colletotrichum musicola]
MEHSANSDDPSSPSTLQICKSDRKYRPPPASPCRSPLTPPIIPSPTAVDENRRARGFAILFHSSAKKLETRRGTGSPAFLDGRIPSLAPHSQLVCPPPSTRPVSQTENCALSTKGLCHAATSRLAPTLRPTCLVSLQKIDRPVSSYESQTILEPLPSPHLGAGVP